MTDLRDDELFIERRFEAPVALVFRLWQERDHLLRWWGPEGFTAVDFDWKLAPGRAWRGAMTSRKFGLSRFSGVIQEVEENRRIVFTFQWQGQDEPETLVTVTLTEKDGGTLQTFHQAPFASVASRDSHVGGWNSLFNKQELYAENFAIALEKGIVP
ncbi:SRPBCC domain-containing protein [Rhodobacterales bacterium]|nr:SRPBCC domain-containing protein [Rhodobacterales bacterium]